MASPKGRSKGPKRRPDPDTGRAGVEPGVRTFTTWTPALLKSAEIAAEQGNIRQAANLCDWLLSDERVKNGIDTRTQALLGLSPTFEATGDGRRSKSVVKALDAQDDYTASYPESELALMLGWGILLGCAPMRHEPTVPDEGHGGRLLPCPKFWHPQHLRHDAPSREWKIRVEHTSGGGTFEETLTPGDSEWLFHTPYGTHRPQMLGLWRGLSRWVLLKYLAMGDLANASAGGSLLAATSEKQAIRPEEIGRSNEKQRAQLGRDIFELGRNGVVILPPGFDLKLIQRAANSESIYTAQINLADEAIAIATRGGNLTTKVEGGSRAAIESQERLGDRAKLDWDGECLTTTLHDQSIVWWAKWNYGSSLLAPYPVYPTKPKKNRTEQAKAIKEACDATEGLLAFGLEVEAQAFLDEWELNGWVKAASGQKLLLLPASPNPAAPPPGKGMSGPTQPGQEPVPAEPEPAEEPDDEPEKTPEAAE